MDDNNFPESKVCTACSEDKPLEDYHRHKKGKYGRQEKCKACKSGIDAAYYGKNAEEIKAAVKKYAKDNPEKIKERQHRQYMKQREERIEKAKVWAQNNPDKVRGYKRKHSLMYNTLIKQQDHSPDYVAILERDGMVCYLCTSEIDPRDHHHDHIIPIIKGGAHADFNIAISHSNCNLRKNATLPEDLAEPQRTNALNKLEQLEKLYRKAPGH